MAQALTPTGTRTVACIGFMGAGKSTAADAIARLTGRRRSTSTTSSSSGPARRSSRSSPTMARPGSGRRGANHAGAAGRPLSPGTGAGRRRDRVRGGAGGARRAIWCCGSTLTSPRPGAECRTAVGRWPATARSSSVATPAVSRSTRNWPMSSSRHRATDGDGCCARLGRRRATRHTRHLGRERLGQLSGVHRRRTCWSAIASGRRWSADDGSWSPTATPDDSTDTRSTRWTAGLRSCRASSRRRSRTPRSSGQSSSGPG